MTVRELIQKLYEFDGDAEVDNPCPDYTLRSLYRKKLVSAVATKVDQSMTDTIQERREVNIGVELVTDTKGNVLWIERYIFNHMHGEGETFFRNSKRYRVVKKGVLTISESNNALIEHIVEEV